MLDGPFIEITILLAYLNLISFRRRTLSRIHSLSCCLCHSCQHHNPVFVFYARKIAAGKGMSLISLMKESAAFEFLTGCVGTPQLWYEHWENQKDTKNI